MESGITQRRPPRRCRRSTEPRVRGLPGSRPAGGAPAVAAGDRDQRHWVSDAGRWLRAVLPTALENSRPSRQRGTEFGTDCTPERQLSCGCLFQVKMSLMPLTVEGRESLGFHPTLAGSRCDDQPPSALCCSGRGAARPHPVSPAGRCVKVVSTGQRLCSALGLWRMRVWVAGRAVVMTLS